MTSAWLTPDEPITPSTVCWVLRIPVQFREHVRGALGLLSDYWNWEAAGDMTPQECAEACFGVWDGIKEWCLLGTIHEYCTDSLPDGVLLCDGAVYHRADYPDLYAVLSSAYIDDGDHFHTPDMVNRSPMGTDVLQGEEIGEAAHTLTVDEIPSHHHSIPDGSTFPYGNIPEVTVTGGVLLSETGDTGGGLSHNNIHPVHKVKYGMIARV